MWNLPAFALRLISWCYRVVVAYRRRFPPQQVRVEVPVISVGNVTVGGTGKTPIVGMLAGRLLRDGLRVGIVSAGYGRAEHRTILEPGYRIQKLSAETVGDEVRLLAEKLPEAIFCVDKSKAHAARMLAADKRVDVIIVDDGFQHRKLARDIDIVTYDASLKPKLLKMFPYGLLREPLSALDRADVVIVTRARFATDISETLRALRRYNDVASFYTAQFVPSDIVNENGRLPVKYLKDKSAFLFAGVGNFESLRRQVAALVGDLDGWLELSDHQRYNPALLRRIRHLAEKHNSDLLLTTAKDWVKLGHFDFGREIYYVDITVDLDPGEEKLTDRIRQRLNLARRQP
ncbi:MAG: tetraacyldisaccharide 4'-kinase [Candidatus Zixiibacteriota bacterium]|nr:MAG: tetraacyldisaccharide 4'-kinase [candidate division Zixibacteria bacterium]